MYKNRSILAIVAARGGSKGVPRKNIRMAGGKPLIAWVIESAKESKYIDRLILSSDDSEIIQTAKKHGCEVPFVRPKGLAEDNSSVNDVVIHALEQISGHDYVMLLQPTSPLTQSKDIDGCIQLVIDAGMRSVVSVTEPSKSPFWMFELENSNRLKPLMGEKLLNTRRQDLPSVFIPTGAAYVAESRWFLENQSFYSRETAGFIIPPDRSVDIDTMLDFKLFEEIIKSE